MCKIRFLFVLAVVFTCVGALAQPQWRFHLAFEDATGARDTIWFVYDTTATLGWDGDPLVDTALGEGPVEMDLDVFNVWVYNWTLDSTKTVAYPYTFFPSHDASIYASNFQYPLTLRWDTSLFHAGFLPDPSAINSAQMICDHFFFFNNDPLLQAYNMLLDDSVVVELMFPNDWLFPLGVFWDHDGMPGIDEIQNANEFIAYPNPASDHIYLHHPQGIRRIRLFDGQERLLLTEMLRSDQATLELSSLSPGAYLIEVVTHTNQYHHARFIKQD